MIKPNNYDNTQASGEFSPIELGGHKLVIKQVEELSTANGIPYIKVSFDTAKSDKQPGFYAASYKADTRNPKKWGGVTTVFVNEVDSNNTSRQFKTFCTSVEHSNPGFRIVWGDQFCAALKDKAIGGVFGEEEFEANDGSVKTARKLRWFCGTDSVDGAKVPDKKCIKKQNAVPSYISQAPAGGQDFALLADEDAQLPF